MGTNSLVSRRNQGGNQNLFTCAVVNWNFLDFRHLTFTVNLQFSCGDLGTYLDFPFTLSALCIVVTATLSLSNVSVRRKKCWVKACLACQVQTKLRGRFKILFFYPHVLIRWRGCRRVTQSMREQPLLVLIFFKILATALASCYETKNESINKIVHFAVCWKYISIPDSVPCRGRRWWATAPGPGCCSSSPRR